ncbi:MAG TPA: response regulator [Longimicrobium sp.]|nr:response regulator [Longimicrobium sp.]
MVAFTLASAERSPLVPHHRPATGGDKSRGSESESAAPSVLIAEDHADSRDALRALLEAFGYRVYVAGDGHEAVAEARAHHPDLILMDMMMPGMDGMEATRALRADPDFARVPIVAVTAMEGSRERVLSAGCDDWVAKPINIRAFLARVPEWLGSARTEAS